MRRHGVSTLLLIEIGGTHTRCAVSRGGGPPDRIALFDNADYDDIESVVTAYLEDVSGEPPARAALAIAAPVDDPPVRLTNLGWTIDPGHLTQHFGWRDAVLVNDFEALACALPWLSADELVTIRSGTPSPRAPKAVLGPGTGLGVSALIPAGSGWYPVGGEGGHVTLAASDDREAAIIAELRRLHGHVSAERVLCGPGLLDLYRLLAKAPAADSPLDVTRLAEAGDPQAREAVGLFFRFLGTISSDLALTLGARGGVFLGGGILPHLKADPAWTDFKHRFLDKGRFADYLQAMPVYLITARTPALRGLAAHPAVKRRDRD